MPHTISLSTETYKRLGQFIQEFDDTPDIVIKRLLDSQEAVERTEYTPRKYDVTQYLFNGNTYGKSRLVLAVVKEHVMKNLNISYDHCLESFPERLASPYRGVFTKKENAQRIYDTTGHRRHFLQPEDIIELNNCYIAVSTLWSRDNINNFINHASTTLGYDISIKNN